MTKETLTAEEQAYFDTQGEAAPVAEVETVTETAATSDQNNETSGQDDHLDAQQDAQPDRAKQVPHQALHQERERRKAAEERARNHELALERLQERVKIYEAAFTPQREANPPSHEEDFFAAAKHDRAELENVKKTTAQIAQEIQQFQAAQAIRAQVNFFETEFVKEKPDYLTAIEFLKKSRADELRRFGHDDRSIQNIILAEENDIVLNSLNRGENPAKFAYEIAEGRGYRKNGVTSQPVATQADPEKIMRAQTASKSLSGAGSSPTGPMTPERLASMSEREFAAYYAKNPDTVERLSGRG